VETQKIDLSLLFFGASNTSFFQQMHQNDFGKQIGQGRAEKKGYEL